MAFDGNNFTPLGGTSRSGVAPVAWSYQTSADTLALVAAANYFNTINKIVRADELIYVAATDGKAIFTILSVNRALKLVVLDSLSYLPGDPGKKYAIFRIIAADTDVAVASSIGGDFRLPFAGTLVEVGAYVDVAGVTGTQVADINLSGATIMTTDKLDIETGEKSTENAAQQPVLTTTTTAFSKDDIFNFDVDAIQSTVAKGLTIWFDIDV